MLQKTTLSAAVVFACSLSSTQVAADVLAVGVKGGTLGLGLELVAQASDSFNLRLQHTRFSRQITESSSGGNSDLEFDLELDIGATSLLVDFHPLAGSFRLTAGYGNNANQFVGSAVPSGSYEIGDNVYSAADVGTVNGRIDFKSAAPYLGFGWGNAFAGDGGFSMNLDIGVFLQGAPQVQLSTSKQLSDPAAQALLQQNLDKETTNFEDDSKDLKAWPVVALGVSYLF
ncbi:MAG TPA: hypothetical protein DF774_07700 [Rheinheimera sp.]|uniref:hypothetical protein n=1 Tax=Rheinheimera sp. TaxID=1869214 RepID=UPI000EC7CFCC|nr:hypothetical protein [Rheinheimera sp.]HCU65625.1 hypothetical protein [Rheinheimera sp.]